MPSQHPVVVIGAGPIGLAAAAELVAQGIEPVVVEAGPHAGATVREWAHVRLFSPWSGLIAPAARQLLSTTGWRRPNPASYPTGADWVADYLEPLAAALGDRVRFDTRVTGVARAGRDRVVDAGRDELPLTVHVQDATGTQSGITARAVIDASGTWNTPNPLGGDGYPAIGEAAASGQISYRIPDVRDPATKARYAGKRVAVVGSGHSALTALVDLSADADETGTHITWVLRRGTIGDTFGGGSSDQLPARGALGQRARDAVEAGHIDVVTGFRTERVDKGASGRVVLAAEDGRELPAVDEVVVLTGLRPDLSFVEELRLDLDVRLDAPVALAPMIDPNIHSCGSVPPHGVNELSHPEKDVYLVGMKAYGRAPTFLAMTGFEQVRSIAAALAGDRDSADRVELTLPETGVCGGAGLLDAPDATKADDAEGADSAGACCGGSVPQTITLEPVGIRTT